MTGCKPIDFREKRAIQSASKPRARDLGLPFSGQPGRYNAITDVPGGRVGFTTLTEPADNIRTGVTAILPRGSTSNPSPVWAGQYSLNGNGEMTGTHWINDAGYFLGPICITNTRSVGMVHHAATRWMIDTYSGFFENEHAWAMSVVAETYDGVLSDINGQHVTAEHARNALNSASDGPVEEGSVSGGNGMVCYEFKGGTGTSSRQVEIGDDTYTIGALVQANHGIRPWLDILGKPVGRIITEGRLLEKETGSIIVIIATDAPLSGRSLRQVAKRAAISIGRGGSPSGNNSGEIFLVISVANERPMPQLDTAVVERTELNNEHLDPLYLSAVEAIEEAVVNAMVAGEDVPTFKPGGHICPGIDREELAGLFKTEHRTEDARGFDKHSEGARS